MLTMVAVFILPAFFISAAISTCVIFSPKDRMVSASSCSVIMPSLSPSNSEKHSLNSMEQCKRKINSVYYKNSEVQHIKFA